jgi:hypothetical protein
MQPAYVHAQATSCRREHPDLFAKSRKCDAKAGVDAERKVCEIRLRTERKAGALLAKRDKAKPRGSNQHQDRSRHVTDPQPLRDLGVSPRRPAADPTSVWGPHMAPSHYEARPCVYSPFMARIAAAVTLDRVTTAAIEGATDQGLSSTGAQSRSQQKPWCPSAYPSRPPSERAIS